MMRGTWRRNGPVLAVLLFAGIGWGFVHPLTKIVLEAGYQPFELIFWQALVAAIVLSVVALLRRRKLPMDGQSLVFAAALALVGTVLPNAASYHALNYLPAGIVGMLLSLVPLMALPMTLVLGLEKLTASRLAGLSTGFVAVMLMVAPDAALPEPEMALFIPLALIAPFLYAFEGSLVDRWQPPHLDPLDVLTLASLIALIISLPLALLTGHLDGMPETLGGPESLIALMGVINAVVYTTYVWIIQRAGPVFAVQISYVVTIAGVFLAMWILGERYSAYIWASLVLMLVGLFLVQPRPQSALAPEDGIAQDERRN